MSINASKLCCPSCGAGIDMDINGKKNIFCPYCGTQFEVERNEITINSNINKNIYIHKRYTDDAAIEKERRKEKEKADAFATTIEIQKLEYKKEKRIMIICIGMMLFGFLMIALVGIWEEFEEKSKLADGYVKIGQSSRDMEGKNYKVVSEQLRSAGFKNIVTIDLEDETWFLQNNDDVESVSIGGVTSFETGDFFNPDDKIIISYH